MSFHTELCAAEPTTRDERRLAVLNTLYELRLHLAEVSTNAGRAGLLVASLKATEAHTSIVEAIQQIESHHPELI